MNLNYTCICYYCGEIYQANRSTSKYCCPNYNSLYNANGPQYNKTMIIARGVTGIDKSARDYLSSAEATEGLIAMALVIGSSFQRIMGNFFISVNKTSMPVRMFTTESGAGKWLKKFII